MEINKHGHNLKPHLPVGSAVSGNAPAAEANASEAVDSTDRAKAQRLLAGLQGNAEVRNRLLVEIQAKVHAGEYNTRVAAERAAEQIVGL